MDRLSKLEKIFDNFRIVTQDGITAAGSLAKGYAIHTPGAVPSSADSFPFYRPPAPPPPPYCPTITLTCDQIMSARGKVGWYVQSPDSGYGNPPKVYKKASVVVQNHFDNFTNPSTDDYIYEDYAWSATATIPDCANVGFIDFAQPVRIGCTSDGLVTIDAGQTGYFINHYHSDPDLICGSLDIVSFAAPGHVNCLQVGSPSPPGVNCCCGVGSVDTSFYGDVWNICASPSAVISVDTKTDDHIDKVCDLELLGPGYNHHETHIVLTDEDTTGALILRTEGCLPSYPGTWDGGCRAIRDFDTYSEMNYTIYRFKPKFSIDTAQAADLLICYNEEFTPADGGDPTYTPRTVTIPAGETEVIGPEVLEPVDNGHIDITDVTCCP